MSARVEERHRQLIEDLSDALEGEIRADGATLSLYSTDASLYEIRPLAVAFPRSAADVSVLAAYASRHQIPLIPRGSGTGLVGGCLGSGIVIDFARHLNRVISIDRRTVRVQPGMTLSALNARLKPLGRCFAPDPSGAAITSIGGMIGVDAAGSRAFCVGSTRDHLHSLQCVLMGGQILELGHEQVHRQFAIRQPVTGLHDQDLPRPRDGILPPVRNENLPLVSLTPATRRLDLLERLAALLAEVDDDIRTHQPALLRNCSGYMLRGILRRDTLDLPRLIAGSEGTLALVTEATLYTQPLPAHRGALVLMFPTMDAALSVMQLLLILEPSACDLLDRRLLSLGREADRRFDSIVRPDAESGLFVEFVGADQREVEARLASMKTLLRASDVPHVISAATVDPREVELIWSLPSHVVPLLARLKGDSRPLPFVEDIAVPPPRISEFLTLAQKTLQKHEVTATLYAHAASGQLHLRPMLPVPEPGKAEHLEAIARDLYRHVKTVGGTISGEHGDGLARTAFIRSQYGPLYRIFQQVKDIFDPQQLLNPDKIITNDGQLTVRHLRNPVAKTRPAGSAAGDGDLLPVLQLTWQNDQAMAAAVRCNGCGTCRTVSGDLRMCPFFHDEPSEQYSPRAKANLLRQLLTGRSSADLLNIRAVRQVAESCFNCKQCQLECPSEVDIPHMMLELRAQNVASNGLSQVDWLLSRFHTYARLASAFRGMANRLMKYGVFRQVLQKSIGIAEKRRLPQFAPSPFMKSLRVQSEHNAVDPNSSTPTVVYFVDYFANHHDPQLAEAFVRILQHNGFRVYIPPLQTVSGMAMIAVGDLEAARQVADANLTILSEAVREGCTIVCTEPSAALCLRQEYPVITNHRDADFVAKQTFDAGTFLWDLHSRGKLKTDFESLDLTVAYHTPCHVKALGPGAGMRRLLDLIPGVTVTDLEKGCSGMAGTFGLAAEHFQQSLHIGAELIQAMKTTDVVAGVTDCSSCRMQMEQEATRPTVHPLKLLALAYGLMPELKSSLTSRPTGTVMS
ncbi:MAG: anaerobic glycerol-3-phosphate dehydrogenase subunit C [Planctomycetaceae bacterium]